MGKWIHVDFTICQPETCDPENGICPAALVCTHKLLIQEAPFDEPMLLSVKMCVGCGDCVKVCPLGVLKILQGY